MKCSKCGKKNVRKANYCKCCGYEFTDKEKEKAANSGIIGIINFVQKADSIRTLSIITDNIIFKIAVVLIVLAIGIYKVITIGSDLKVLDSKIYDVEFNQKNEEYYILVDKEVRDDLLDISLELYIPNRIENLNLTYYTENGDIISEDTYSKDDQIKVLANVSEDNYYIISNVDNENENLKIFVYYGKEE